MDTNQQNNIYVNSFEKGMCTDVSYDRLQPSLYVFAENLRITANSLLGYSDTSNDKHGILAPVEVGESVVVEFVDEYGNKTSNSILFESILATCAIENVGAMIVKTTLVGEENSKWVLFKATFVENKIQLLKLYTSKGYTNKTQFSVVMNKEREDIIKLYIADGVNPVMSINLCDPVSYFNYITEDRQLSSFTMFPSDSPRLVSFTTGQLKTQQLQYCYRFYRNHGNATKVSPLTPKIQIINDSFATEQGCAEDSTTGLGVKLAIKKQFNIYDRIQIYRLSYVKQHQQAEINLIYDGEFNYDDNNEFVFSDTGIEPVAQLSNEEFLSLNSYDFVPQLIEKNQGYLFSANITDNSSLYLEHKDVDTVSRSTFLDPSLDGYYYKDGSYTDYITWNPSQPRPENFDKYIINKEMDINAGMLVDEFTDVRGMQIYGKDGCIGGIGTVSWNLVGTYIDENGTNDGSLYKFKPNANGDGFDLIQLSHTCDDYLEQLNISIPYKKTYKDKITSSVLRSLSRDETYRYGIVLYDKYGRTSEPKWVTDVHVPPHSLLPLFTNVQQHIEPEEQGLELYTNVSSESRNFKRALVGVPTYLDEDIDQLMTSAALWFNVKAGLLYKIYPYNRAMAVLSMSNVEDLMHFDFERAHKLDVEKYGMKGHYTGKFTDSSGKVTYDEIQEGYLYTALKDETISVRLNRISFTPGKQYQLSYVAADPEYSTSEMWDSGEVDYLFQVSVYENNISPTPTPPSTNNGYLSLGVMFNVDMSALRGQGVTGYEIVRCEKTRTNSKKLFSGVLSKPVNQDFPEDRNKTDGKLKMSPYYPTGFITTQQIQYKNGYSAKAGNMDNHRLFQFFCPEMQVIRNDALAELQGSDTYLKFCNYLYGMSVSDLCDNLGTDVISVSGDPDVTNNSAAYFAINYSQNYKFKLSDKASQNLLILFTTSVSRFNNGDYSPFIDSGKYLISSNKDVKNPNWSEGFTQITYNGSNISGGIKQYKSFNTNTNEYQYVNWISSAMFDMKLGVEESTSITDDRKDAAVFTDANHKTRKSYAKGPIGPGPQCCIIELSDLNDIEDKKDVYPFYGNFSINYSVESASLGAVTADIIHDAQLFAGYTVEEHKFDTYSGFGFRSTNETAIVFDGDKYIMDCEYTSMYKAYDFRSLEDTLVSQQIVYRIPHETSINQYFDYGLNYRNTQSNNLLLEPGSISGIAIQGRPEHQYNMIYSDNNSSIMQYSYYDVERFSNIIGHRIMYSEYKTNGEDVDSFLSFKPAQFLDVDTTYGSITQLSTVQNILYFWQKHAFGKLSVNEKSLVKDLNSNDIMLGQSGILQRHDYLSTTYGMREQDFSNVAVDTMVMWVDFNNKAILGTSESGVVNLGTTQGVQNIINERMLNRPKSIRDVQHNEVLFDCFLHDGKKQLLVFNYSLNAFTSVYNRLFFGNIAFQNNLIELQIKPNGYGLYGINVNYNNANNEFLSPTVVQFVVNGQNTKTFDTQEIVTEDHTTSVEPDADAKFLIGKRFKFETNLMTSGGGSNLKITDREGNIKYAIPRQYNSIFGARLKGKWMLTTFENDKPCADYTISRVHTKFRTSFS